MHFLGDDFPTFSDVLSFFKYSNGFSLGIPEYRIFFFPNDLGGSHPNHVRQPQSVVRICMGNMPDSLVKRSVKHFAFYISTDVLYDLGVPSLSSRLSHAMRKHERNKRCILSPALTLHCTPVA